VRDGDPTFLEIALVSGQSGEKQIQHSGGESADEKNNN
jgi:hypothetical protein